MKSFDEVLGLIDGHKYKFEGIFVDNDREEGTILDYKMVWESVKPLRSKDEDSKYSIWTEVFECDSAEIEFSSDDKELIYAFCYFADEATMIYNQ